MDFPVAEKSAQSLGVRDKMLSLFAFLRNDILVDSPLPALTERLYLDRNKTDVVKLGELYKTRRNRDDMKPWPIFFGMSFRFYLMCLPSPPTFMLRLHDENFWEKLYYSIGEKAFEELIKRTELYYKYASGVFVQFSSNLEPAKRVPRKRKLNEEGNSILDCPIPRKRMFYSWHRKNSARLIPSRSMEGLCEAIIPRNYHISGDELSLNTTSLERILEQRFTVRFFRQELNKFCQERVVPPSKVVQFVHIILDMCVPPDLLGRDNLETFKANVRELITSTTYRLILVKDVVKNFNWPSSQSETNGIVLVAMWLARTFVVELLCCVFTCLDSNRRKEPIFFKSTVWRRFVKSCKKQLFALGQVVTSDVPDRDPRISLLVTLPKPDGGFRPLIRQSEILKHDVKFLDKCNIFLKQVVRSKTDRSPSFYSDFHVSWRNFVSRTTKKKVFFVKCDIKDAFGSINHKLLKSMLVRQTKTLPGPILHLQYFIVKSRPWVKPRGMFTELPLNLPEGVFIPGQSQTEVDSRKLVNGICYFIDNNFIQVMGDKKVLRVVNGLPQGAKLSSALCDLYYSFVDDFLLDLYKPDEGDVFLRCVDDYIFISADKSRCVEFFRRMNLGMPPFGVCMKPEKTVTNLVSTDLDDFIYLGFVLNPRKRCVQLNFDQYKLNFDQIIALDSNMSRTDLQQRMANMGLLKLYDVLYDGSYHCKRQIMMNLFLMSCVHALRYHFILLRVKENHLSNDDEEDNVQVIIKVSKAVSSSLFAKKLFDSVTSEALQYIVLRAFRNVLIKSDIHKNVVLAIEQRASNLKFSCGVRERKLLKECTKHCPSFVDVYF